MKLLVGLGNPGPQYARQRHNLGYMAVDAIAAAHGFSPWRRRFQGEATEGRLAGQPTLLLKPTTYMNESGRSVGEAMRFYKIALEDMVVFHDEIDLAPGKVKVKAGGGSAGHNGLKSITQHIGNDYRRVRLGIGHPGHKDRVQGYVLHDFAKVDEDWLAPLLDGIARAAPNLVTGGDDRFINDVFRTAQTPDEKPELAAKARPTQRATAKPDPVKEHESGRALGNMLRRWLGMKSE